MIRRRLGFSKTSKGRNYQTNLQGRILNLGYSVYTWGKTKNGVKGVVRVVNEGVLLN